MDYRVISWGRYSVLNESRERHVQITQFVVLSKPWEEVQHQVYLGELLSTSRKQVGISDDSLSRDERGHKKKVDEGRNKRKAGKKTGSVHAYDFIFMVPVYEVTTRTCRTRLNLKKPNPNLTHTHNPTHLRLFLYSSVLSLSLPTEEKRQNNRAERRRTRYLISLFVLPYKWSLE